MPLTLDWLLARDELDLRLVTDTDPAGVVIDWVHSIELPDPSPWLAGGELVLTVGLRLPRARAEQAAYVRRLSEAGVAALAFGTGVRFETVPDALQRACADLGVPLVDVPLPTPFVAVTQAIARRIAELQYESMERTVEFQRRLTSAALHDGARGVVRGLADELGGGVLLLDEHRHAVESERCRPDLADRVRRELDRHPGGARTSLRLADDDRSTEIQSLGGRADPRGWLAIDVTAAMSPTDRVLLNQAASVLTLLLDRPAELLAQRRRVGASVLDLLLDPAGAERGAEHLRAFGFEHDDDVVLLACTGLNDEQADAAAASLDLLRIPYVASALSDATLVIAVRSADADGAAEHLATHLSAAGARDATVGVSPALRQDAVYEGVSAARYAAESARWSHTRVGRHDSMTLAGVLADDEVRGRVTALAAAPMARLRDHPRLVESLEVFLRTNGSWETASRLLGVHRHTLRNRMARVEEITGLSMDVAENRVVLLLALLTR
ncbi:PucR family transcriptional regulator [Solicola gregarius]|uniref:PucR family transcriptional regulator n=1 Tax=Solicola gregarius TaxID=2908642 RepID=A0AA46YNK4_9ACTN|nr:PucR family transcriptional regulator [Solicola gregarius]UYM07571.1 PucR family transcriptional regulator [Solicola gregarius]